MTPTHATPARGMSMNNLLREAMLDARRPQPPQSQYFRTDWWKFLKEFFSLSLGLLPVHTAPLVAQNCQKSCTANIKVYILKLCQGFSRVKFSLLSHSPCWWSSSWGAAKVGIGDELVICWHLEDMTTATSGSRVCLMRLLSLQPIYKRLCRPS